MDEKRDLELGENTAQQPAYVPGPSQQPAGYGPQPPSYPGSYGAPPVNTAYAGTSVPPQPGQQTYVTQVTTTKVSSFDSMKGAIPIMPLWLAIFCFFINCILPGFGTITGSFSVFCCADTRDKKSSRCGTFCLNFWIGWMQLITLFIFLIGWFWSIMWGWLFVAYSLEFYGKDPQVTTVTRTVAVPVNQQLPPGYATQQTTYQTAAMSQ